MSTLNITAALEARATANEWLISHLRDRFAAGTPEYDAGLAGWRIAVWLAYPGLEPLGPTGEMIVDDRGTVRTHTPLDEMRGRAIELYQQHRDQIEAPLL
ncbi:MAG: hypothetical protein DMF60_00775 [Acidobacteria bacterium]|nr:MAG: hypothetical protein DMF60_00775 [Acidobacteriota bacterium]